MLKTIKQMEYDIVINGTIGGWDCLSTGYVKYLLDQKKNKEVHVAFCSLGGYVKDGLVLNQLFKDHGNVHAHAFGMNASISTIAMLGCKSIDIVKGSFFLIHNTSTLVLKYDNQNKEQLDEFIKEMTQQRNNLSTFDDVLAQMYAERSGKTKEECAAQMKKGNWLSAEQAFEFGLVDEIRKDENDDRVTNMYHAQLNAYKYDNQLLTDVGIPPLPKEMTEEGKGNPTQSFWQKTLQELKNLLLSNNVDKQNMSELKKDAIEKALGVDSIEVKNDVISLTAEQAKLLNEKLSNVQEEERKDEEKKEDSPESDKTSSEQVEDVMKEIENLKKELKSKDEQIENLKKSAGTQDETEENPKNEAPALTASAIFNSVKNV